MMLRSGIFQIIQFLLFDALHLYLLITLALCIT